MIHLLVLLGLVVLVAEQPVKMVLAAVLAAEAHSQGVPDTQQVQHYKADLQTHQMAVVEVEVVAVTGAVAQEAMGRLQTPAVAVVRAITTHRLLLRQY